MNGRVEFHMLIKMLVGYLCFRFHHSFGKPSHFANSSRLVPFWEKVSKKASKVPLSVGQQAVGTRQRNNTDGMGCESNFDHSSIFAVPLDDSLRTVARVSLAANTDWASPDIPKHSRSILYVSSPAHCRHSPGRLEQCDTLQCAQLNRIEEIQRVVDNCTAPGAFGHNIIAGDYGIHTHFRKERKKERKVPAI